MNFLKNQPLDLKPYPHHCDCEFTPDPEDPDEDTIEKAWHYLRRCARCGCVFWSLHCLHDGVQSRCPDCHNYLEVVEAWWFPLQPFYDPYYPDPEHTFE